jgi:tRNA-dihydrouridine synthase
VDGPSAKHFKDTYGVDGLMIGRASYGNPWIFGQIRHYLETGEELPLPDVKERVRVSRIHLQRSIEWKGEHIALLEIRKHWAAYFKGLPNFKPFKMLLMETLDVDETMRILDEIEQNYNN